MSSHRDSYDCSYLLLPPRSIANGEVLRRPEDCSRNYFGVERGAGRPASLTTTPAYLNVLPLKRRRLLWLGISLSLSLKRFLPLAHGVEIVR